MTDDAPEPARDGQRFGAWLDGRRERLDLSSAEVARRATAAGAPVTGSQVRQIRLGRAPRPPEQPLFSALCRAVGGDEADALRAAGLLPGPAGAPPTPVTGLDAMVAHLPPDRRAAIRRIVREAVALAEGGEA